MKYISKRKLVLKILVFLLLFIIFFSILSKIFERKDFHNVTIDGFYNLEENSQDVLFFGSSHVFCSIIPNLLLEEFGIESYLLSTSEQPLQASYYLMVESLKTQSPSVIVLDTHMVNKSSYVLEKGSRIHHVTDSMKFSTNRYEAIESLTRLQNEKLPFQINLFEYHNRWGNLTNDDFLYRRDDVDAQYRGYYFREESNVVNQNEFDIYELEAVQIDNTDLEYLEKIVEFTEHNDIQLILISTPWMISAEDAEVQISVIEYASYYGINYYDGTSNLERYDIKLDEDFYDFHHLNNKGASKFTKHFGSYLVENLKWE